MLGAGSCGMPEFTSGSAVPIARYRFSSGSSAQNTSIVITLLYILLLLPLNVLRRCLVSSGLVISSDLAGIPLYNYWLGSVN